MHTVDIFILGWILGSIFAISFVFKLENSSASLSLKTTTPSHTLTKHLENISVVPRLQIDLLY